MVNTVEIPPLVWEGWKDGYNYSSTGKLEGVYINHYLTELGRTTNGYQYAVRANGIQLFKVVTLRPSCCEGMRTCPIGKRELPQDCRHHLRQEAERLAYEVWVQYIKNLVGTQ